MSESSEQPEGRKQFRSRFNQAPLSGQAAGQAPAGRKRRAPMSDISNVLSEVVKKYGLDQSLKIHALTSYWPHAVGEPFASMTRPLFIDFEGNLVVSVKDASVAQELSFKKQQLMNSLKPLANSVGIKLSGLRFDLKNYTRIVNLDEEAEYRQAQKAQNTFVDKLRKEEPEDADLDAIELPEEEIEELAAMRESLLYEGEVASGAAFDAITFVEQGPVLGDSPFSVITPDVPRKAKTGTFLPATGGDSTSADGSVSAYLSADRAFRNRILALYERELRLRHWRSSRGYPSCSRCGSPQPRLHGTSELCAGCYVEALVARDS